MGLGGGRKRVKIGNDPNNETWARSTGNYGHRMLVSQGWTPGGTLGSTDNAAYSAHLTEASQSHIRVKLREDNLGLGAKRGSGQEAGECVGLDAFQGLLGRLNGKSDEALEREQRSRDDLKRARYVESRGMVRFVRGGTLVHDMEELVELARRSRISMGLERDGGDDAGDDGQVEKRRRRRRQKKESRKEASAQEDEGGDDTEVTSKAMMMKKKKSKKRKHRDAEASNEELEETNRPAPSSRKASEADSNSDASEDEKAARARRKAAKAERREEKRQKREKKAAKRAAAAAAATLAEASLIREEADAEPVVQETLIVEPATTQETKQALQQEVLGGRHTSVRSRYIAAKRRAVMDPQALKEILMVKA